MAAGGRYDKMVEKINPNYEVPCVGFTIGIEEIFKILRKRVNFNLECIRKIQTEVLVVSEQGNLTEGIKLCAGLWGSKIKVCI